MSLWYKFRDKIIQKLLLTMKHSNEFQTSLTFVIINISYILIYKDTNS